MYFYYFYGQFFFPTKTFLDLQTGLSNVVLHVKAFSWALLRKKKYFFYQTRAYFISKETQQKFSRGKVNNLKKLVGIESD